MIRMRYSLAALLPLIALSGCAVGPTYHRPFAPVPTHYQRLPGWTQAVPAAAGPKGDWWTGFHDPLLDKLEPQVAVSNQTVRVDYYAWRQSRAFVTEARGQLFPSVALGGSAGESQARGLAVSSGSLLGSVSWLPDIWGQIRRNIEERRASAQESAAILANATLSEQAALAADVIDLRVADADIALLRKTVRAYRASLRIVKNQIAAGTAAPSDLITARTALEGARASLINAGVARAEYAHAVAVLVGRLPGVLAIPPSTALPTLPAIPVGIPSTLLERRPDIAAAERAMAAANAAIGVQIAAFYPTITLSAAGGFSASPLGALFTVANQVWSLGTDAAINLFEGGARRAAVGAAWDVYKADVANYRGTVLTTFQQVEDNLSTLRILAHEAAVEARAVRDAGRAVQIALNEYQSGTQDYTTVVSAQVTLLADQQTALNIRQQRLLAAVDLIQALGGGWSSADLTKKPVR
jgi:NodT family efflux transporter outer membrane factor (OMF) lipoprotein